MWSKTQLLKLRRNIHLAATSLDDETAVETPELFPAWEVGHDYAVDDRIQYGGDLYKVIQAHRSQADWTPDVSVSLFEKIEKPGTGTHDDPIKYKPGMALKRDLYYTQYDVLYICIRGSGIAVWNDLKDMVGNYVEVAE